MEQVYRFTRYFSALVIISCLLSVLLGGLNSRKRARRRVRAFSSDVIVGPSWPYEVTHPGLPRDRFSCMVTPARAGVCVHTTHVYDAIAVDLSRDGPRSRGCTRCTSSAPSRRRRDARRRVSALSACSPRPRVPLLFSRPARVWCVSPELLSTPDSANCVA